jgi:hypothetical protein
LRSVLHDDTTEPRTRFIAHLRETARPTSCGPLPPRSRGRVAARW